MRDSVKWAPPELMSVVEGRRNGPYPHVAPPLVAQVQYPLKETTFRKWLLAIAFAGLGAGLILQYFDTAPRPQIVWTAATLPAIALLSMSATLVLGQPLATIVLAIIYAGGTVLEDFARGGPSVS